MSCKVWDRSQTPRILMSGSREPGARERERERLFLATMPSSSLPGSQRPREQRQTCLPSSSEQGGSRNECVLPMNSCAFGCPHEHTVPVFPACSGGRAPAMHFSCLSPSLGVRGCLLNYEPCTRKWPSRTALISRLPGPWAVPLPRKIRD